MAQTQSVLLGLGGTGSRIVKYVSDELKKKKIKTNDGNICCVVVDTNKSDQNDLRENGVSIPVIGTSKQRNIATYMKLYENDGVDEWMPTSPTLLKESMLDGASQMRSKSRLAFYDTVKDGSIRDLEKQIEVLFSNRQSGKVRVMIVSSLAGGTGAGMFIQTALWIREFFKKRGCPVTIRGLLVLPDVFIRTISQISGDPLEVRSLRANAYGAIRELNAINKIKTKNFKPVAPIKVDDLFDSESEKANDGEAVFDHVFFMDDVTETGSALKDIVSYEKAIARLAYMQLFAPIESDMNSEEDNLFKRYQMSKDPLYGSCGTAKAIYPTESIIEYCAYRATQDSLAAGWKKIDEEIKTKLNKEKESERKGKILTHHLDPRAEYMRLFEEKIAIPLEKAGKNRLFNNIAADVKIIKEEEPVCKIDDFSDKIDTLVKDAIARANPGNIKNLKIQDSSEDWMKSSSTKSDLNSITETNEQIVSSFTAKISKIDEELAENIVNILCPNDMGDFNENNPSSIIGLFTKLDRNNELYYIHPIAMRYLLYKLAAYLEGLKDMSVVEKAKKQFEKGPQVNFDNPKTKKRETMKDFLDSKGFLQSEASVIALFKGLYYDYNKKQNTLCYDYAEKLIKQKVATMLAKRVETITKIIESFFKNLDQVHDALSEKVRANVRETEEIGQKIFYICASGEEKESLYSSLGLNTGNSDKEINKIIANAFYTQFCVNDNPEAEGNRKCSKQSVISAFFNEVTKTYKNTIEQEYSEEIDLDIYSAICKSAEIEYQKTHQEDEYEDKLNIDESGEAVDDDEKYMRGINAMRDVAEMLKTNSSPFLHAEGVETSEVDKTMIYWGFNPVLKDKCEKLGEILEVNVETQQNKAYSKNELDCFRAVYGIPANGIGKFNESFKDNTDNYYGSYEKIVNMMTEGVANGDHTVLVQTPHLDKTWHKILPFVTEEQEQKHQKEFFESFWIALAYGMIRVDKDGNYTVMRKSKTSMGTVKETPSNLLHCGEVIQTAAVWKLIESLRTDDAFAMDVKSYREEYEKECKNIVNYEGTKFLRGFEKEDITAEPCEDGTKPKKLYGGLGSNSDINALTILVRYNLNQQHDSNITTLLVDCLDGLCKQLVGGKYTKGEDEKIQAKTYELYSRIMDNCQMSKKNYPEEIEGKWAKTTK